MSVLETPILVAGFLGPWPMFINAGPKFQQPRVSSLGLVIEDLGTSTNVPGPASMDQGWSVGDLSPCTKFLVLASVNNGSVSVLLLGTQVPLPRSLVPRSGSSEVGFLDYPCAGH